ncbi:MAG: hypothetical protein M5U35_15170 [Roseovarius sp.]|nr:hypothetical protein [Roseovarius sp.]
MKVSFKRYAAARIIRSGLAIAREIGARGGSAGHGEDGVIVLTCERPEKAITVRDFVVLLAAFLVFKGAVIAHLGAEVYNAALLNLQHGAWFEKAGAFIMLADPVSQAVAARLSSIL